MGGMLQRRPNAPPLAPAEIATAYLEGQAALEERLEYFQFHAQQRLEVLTRLDEEVRALRAEVEQREGEIRSLRAAAGEERPEQGLRPSGPAGAAR